MRLRKRIAHVTIPSAFDCYMYARALRARFRTRTGFFSFCNVAINLSQFIQERSHNKYLRETTIRDKIRLIIQAEIIDSNRLFAT